MATFGRLLVTCDWSVLRDFKLLRFQHHANYRISAQDYFAIVPVLSVLAEIKHINTGQIFALVSGFGEGVFIERQGVVEQLDVSLLTVFSGRRKCYGMLLTTAPPVINNTHQKEDQYQVKEG